jgi:hypothetical protein
MKKLRFTCANCGKGQSYVPRPADRQEPAADDPGAAASGPFYFVKCRFCRIKNKVRPPEKS